MRTSLTLISLLMSPDFPTASFPKSSLHHTVRMSKVYPQPMLRKCATSSASSALAGCLSSSAVEIPVLDQHARPTTARTQLDSCLSSLPRALTSLRSEARTRSSQSAPSAFLQVVSQTFGSALPTRTRPSARTLRSSAASGRVSITPLDVDSLMSLPKVRASVSLTRAARSPLEAPLHQHLSLLPLLLS